MESRTVACSAEVCSVPVRPPETGSVSALRPARTVDASEVVLAGCPPAGSMTVAEPMTRELTLAATAFAPTRADTLAPSGTPDAVPARAGETEPRAAADVTVSCPEIRVPPLPSPTLVGASAPLAFATATFAGLGPTVVVGVLVVSAPPCEATAP